MVYSATDEDWHRIFFEDNGAGIPEANIDKVFELGYSTDGGGFGLAIVKKIIEAHRGDINVHSKQGKGTSFEILLPVRLENARYGDIRPD